MRQKLLKCTLFKISFSCLYVDCSFSKINGQMPNIRLSKYVDKSTVLERCFHGSSIRMINDLIQNEQIYMNASTRFDLVLILVKTDTEGVL